ncbi:hypothetical protein HG531_002035 [Fusarium graminearum]|nr:hypothetical protein HG531_002035 [Fusarium graminearum]
MELVNSGLQLFNRLFSVLKLLALCVEVLHDRKMTICRFPGGLDFLLSFFHLSTDGLASLTRPFDFSLQGLHPLLSTVTPILVYFVVSLVVLKLAQLFNLLLSKHFEVVDGFSIFHSLEYFIETFLQGGWLTQRPERLVLVTENDSIKNCRRYTKALWYHLIHLGLSG